jgi:NAD(P)-dependent dehydrogenase (short-subunit alcohol dehydrogenase family)
MAKKSIENLTKALSIKYSTFGVRVNCVHFGHVLTESSVWAKRFNDDPDAFNNFVNGQTLTKSLITQKEAASFIYNLSNEIFSRNLTGSTFIYDSGSTLIQNKA